MGKAREALKNVLKKHRPSYFFLLGLRESLRKWRARLLGDEKLIRRKYKAIFGKEPNLDDPKTLTEKIQWLKLHCRQDLQTTLADKYAAREWLAERFGREHLIPLLFLTRSWKDIKPENIPEAPCVIKANHGSGMNYICRDKRRVDWDLLRREARLWLGTNYYYRSQEWQYKNIPPRIMVEELLQTKEGKIPNDYKLHFIGGRLEFVYCSIDREGGNYRNIYDANWQPLYFTWVAKANTRPGLRGPEIGPPASFGKMVEIGRGIAKLFKYVRVDFYDADGKLYYGEVTFHHGGGCDIFVPESFDGYYGAKLRLAD